MSEKLTMKTPITYYGGKQNMVKYILPLIPEHDLYCEAFAGGAAIFFAKENVRTNILNDTNRELINFYRVVQSEFVSLEKEIKISLYSRDLHRKASVIYNNSDMFNEVKRAWALWILSSQSFCSIIDGNWGYKRSGSIAKSLDNKKENFTLDLAIKLQNVELECADALYVIRSRDKEGAFFYVDPPYYNSDMGHYDGYSIEDFEALLRLLSTIKGKFMLSSYPSPILQKYIKKYGWNVHSVEGKVSVSSKKTYMKRKVEVLTMNY